MEHYSNIVRHTNDAPLHSSYTKMKSRISRQRQNVIKLKLSRFMKIQIKIGFLVSPPKLNVIQNISNV